MSVCLQSGQRPGQDGEAPVQDRPRPARAVRGRLRRRHERAGGHDAHRARVGAAVRRHRLFGRGRHLQRGAAGGVRVGLLARARLHPERHRQRRRPFPRHPQAAARRAARHPHRPPRRARLHEDQRPLRHVHRGGGRLHQRAVHHPPEPEKADGLHRLRHRGAEKEPPLRRVRRHPLGRAAHGAHGQRLRRAHERAVCGGHPAQPRQQHGGRQDRGRPHPPAQKSGIFREDPRLSRPRAAVFARLPRAREADHPFRRLAFRDRGGRERRVEF